MFLRLTTWCCALSLVWTVACRTPPRASVPERVQRSQPLLGTFVTITVWGTNRPALHDAVALAFDEVRRADAIMSIHRPDSELSRINAEAAARPMPASVELFNVLLLAQQIAAETKGSFDVTVRPLVELWGFLWKEPRLPTASELEAVLPRVGYHQILLDREQRSIRFRAPGVSIDLGGIGKGVAVDMAIAVLQQRGVTCAMVRAGGDLRVIGAPPGQSHWTVQLEDPEKRGQRINIPLRDAALSTSGDYENVLEIGGQRYAHIIDPRSGLPVQGIAACTVIARTCAESDAWATACFVEGPQRSLAHTNRFTSVRFTLRDRPGTPNSGSVSSLQAVGAKSSNPVVSDRGPRFEPAEAGTPNSGSVSCLQAGYVASLSTRTSPAWKSSATRLNSSLAG